MKGCRLFDADAEFIKGGLAPKAPSPVGSVFPMLNPGVGDYRVGVGVVVVGVGVGVVVVVGEEEEEEEEEDG
ncbi:hypothetical protein Tco_0503854 [Tanacetum coccineum]